MAKMIHLPNGFRACLIPKHDSPVFSLLTYVGTGSIHEEEFLGCGLSHFLEHMVFMGSSRHPGNGISDGVTEMGGYLNAYTSKDHTVYVMNLPSGNLAKGLDMMEDLVCHPLFPEEKFLSEKDVILRECAMYMDSAESEIFEALHLRLFRNHPARHPIIGYPEKIKSVTKEMMTSYYSRRYTPYRTFLVAAGDFDEKEAEEKIGELFSTAPMGILKEPFFQPEIKSCSSRETLFFPDPQTRWISGWTLPGQEDPSFVPLKAAMDIFAESEYSYLDRELVMGKNLAYEVTGSMDVEGDLAIGSLYACCKLEKRDSMRKALEKVLKDFLKKGPTKEEIAGMQIRSSSSHALAFLRSESLAEMAGNAILRFGSVEALDARMESLAALSREEIIENARKYFKPESMTELFMLPKETEEKLAPAKKSSSAAKTLAKPELEVMPDGRKVLFLEDKTIPFGGIELYLPCGYFCGKEAMAAGALLADVLPTGTAKYPEEELSRLSSENAIAIELHHTLSALRFQMKFPREKFDLALDLLSSILREPLMEEDKVEREKEALLEEYESALQNPVKRGFNELLTKMTGGFPYYCPAEEMISSLKKLDSATLKKIYNEVCFAPEKMVLGICGDWNKKERKEIIQKLFSMKGSSFVCQEPPPPVFPEKEMRQELALGKNQSVMLIGFPAVPLYAPEAEPLGILGESTSSMSSRLFEVVRNQNGLAYYTGVKIYHLPSTGVGIYYAGTEKNSLPKLELLLKEEMERVAKEGLTTQEIADAKKWIFFREESANQSPFSRLASLVSYEYAALGYEFALERRERLSRMKDEEINRALEKVLKNTKYLVQTIV